MAEPTYILTATPSLITELIATTAQMLLAQERGQRRNARLNRTTRIEAETAARLDARDIVRRVVETLQPTARIVPDIQSPVERPLSTLRWLQVPAASSSR